METQTSPPLARTAPILWFDEAVRYLGLDRQFRQPGQKLRAMIRSRHLKVSGRVGRQPYFTIEELDRFVAAKGDERGVVGRPRMKKPADAGPPASS